jgi:hypothetical protein
MHEATVVEEAVTDIEPHYFKLLMRPKDMCAGALSRTHPASHHALFRRRLTLRRMTGPRKSDWIDSPDTAVGHPLAAHRAHRPVAAHLLHIHSELAVRLSGAVSEAHSATILKPDRTA